MSPRPPESRLRHLAIFLADLKGGGAERMMVSLAAGLAERGIRVDLLLADAYGPYLSELPSIVGLRNLDSGGVMRAIPELARYLRAKRPQLLLTTLHHSSLAALAAKALSRTGTPVFLRESNTPSQRHRTPLEPKRWLAFELMRLLYARADGVIAVSEGVARDTESFYRLPPQKIEVLHNPVVTDDLAALAAQDPGHPWLRSGEPPVLLGVGRLEAQKDFPTLIRAFARLRRRRHVRLIILGAGPDREDLLTLASELGVREDIDLPGFVDNPFAFMNRASAFVLSSKWEGLPGALIQALACGCPVVATDCPSGPAEVLEDGRLGPLVPVGDSEALSRAIEETLDSPMAAQELRRRSLDFGQSRVVRGYVDYFERQLADGTSRRGAQATSAVQ